MHCPTHVAGNRLDQVMIDVLDTVYAVIGTPLDTRPISITPILSKVYEKLVSHKLSSFFEKYGLLPAAQFSYRRGLGCTDALLTISHHLQKYLDARWSLISVSSTLVQPSIE